MVASLFAAFLLLSGIPASAQEAGEKHIGLSFLQIMRDSEVLTSEQSALMSHLLQERREAVALFSGHGLLNRIQLERKILEISDVTQMRILTILDPAQKALWQANVPQASAEPLPANAFRRRIAALPPRAEN